MTPHGLPTTMDTAKVIEYLKQCRASTEDAPDRRYMYLLGRNTLVDVLLVAIYTGEFDVDDFTTTMRK